MTVVTLFDTETFEGITGDGVLERGIKRFVLYEKLHNNSNPRTAHKFCDTFSNDPYDLPLTSEHQRRTFYGSYPPILPPEPYGFPSTTY